MAHPGTIVSLHLPEIVVCPHSIEDTDLTDLLSAYCKYVGSRSTDALRELMKGDLTVNVIPSFQRRHATCITTLSMGVTIEDTDLTNQLSAYCKHVGSRPTDALRELIKRDPAVDPPWHHCLPAPA